MSEIPIWVIGGFLILILFMIFFMIYTIVTLNQIKKSLGQIPISDIKQHTKNQQQFSQDAGDSNSSYKCKECGASLPIDLRHISTYCSSCGASLPKADILQLQSIKHDQKMQEHKAKMDKKNLENKSDQRVLLITFCGIVALLLVMGLLFYITGYRYPGK